MTKNAVDNPILNDPFIEPTRYWDFSSGAPRKLDGRRSSGYYGTLRTDAAEGAQITHQLYPLPLVNEIRTRVGEWRRGGYSGVTNVTRDLLDHWNASDKKRLFFCQREAVETLIWLNEASAADRQGIDIRLDVPSDEQSVAKRYASLRRYCSKMATGSGKTTVMAMLAAWSILNKVANKQDSRFSDAILVVAPNLTVRERLQVLRPTVAGNYYEKFELVPGRYRDLLARGKVCIVNWHQFLTREDTGRGIVKRGRESDATIVNRVVKAELAGAKNVLVFNDEAHHAYRPATFADDKQLELELTSEDRDAAQKFREEATVWVGGLDKLNAVRGIRFIVDLSATPFYLKGTGYKEGDPLPWIVSDFALVDAIESGLTKVPRIPVNDDSGRPDPKYFHLWKHIMKQLPDSERETLRKKAKPESVWREAQAAFATLASKWKAEKKRFEASAFEVPPCLIVVAANTALAGMIAKDVSGGKFLGDLADDATFEINTRVLDEAEAAQGETKDQAKELLRLKTATVGKARWPDDRPPPEFLNLATPPGKDVRCVVSVGMLTEGWDASNVTQILGLRAFGSQLLCEQVVGRGLRRMSYETDPATGLMEPEYCDVFGIPFEVIPVQGTSAKAATPPPPSTLVHAIPEKAWAMIEFPRVDGYFLEVKQKIRCDVDKVPPITIAAYDEPTKTRVAPQAHLTKGMGANTAVGKTDDLTRDAYHAEQRLQATYFRMAATITEKVSKKHPGTMRTLFPQILDVVRAYGERRVKLTGEGARREDVALGKYADVIVERLLDAIEPDTSAGESALLPRLDTYRPVGSTTTVQFRTTRPVKQTQKSHVSHVVLDSSWEGSVASTLDFAPDELVYSFVKNERLDFEIAYDLKGVRHRYIPDYLVRMKDEQGFFTLILEVKGMESEADRAKRAAADKWVRAVNNHAGFGRWVYLQCRNPNELADRLRSLRPSSQP